MSTKQIPTPLNLPQGETLNLYASLRVVVEDQKIVEVDEVSTVEEKQHGYITANSKSYSLIKEMRDVLKASPTKAEKMIWLFLKNKKIGHIIRRQHIIDDFIADFVCLRKKVVIEIDGEIHLQQKENDELRTQRLNDLGYAVIRYTNDEVYSNAELVIQKIKAILDNKADIEN